MLWRASFNNNWVAWKYKLCKNRKRFHELTLDTSLTYYHTNTVMSAGTSAAPGAARVIVRYKIGNVIKTLVFHEINS